MFIKANDNSIINSDLIRAIRCSKEKNGYSIYAIFDYDMFFEIICFEDKIKADIGMYLVFMYITQNKTFTANDLRKMVEKQCNSENTKQN